MLEKLMFLFGYVKIPKNIPAGYHIVSPHICRNGAGRKPKDCGVTDAATVAPPIKPLPGQMTMDEQLM